MNQLESENAVMNQQVSKTGPHRWQPGESGNANGRPAGSRQRIAEKLLADIRVVWEECGLAVLRTLAAEDPGKLTQIAYGLVPKDIFLSVAPATPGNLEPEQWSRLRDILAMVERVAPPGTSADAVLEALENGLRAELARPIELEVLPPCPVDLPSGALVPE
jgi:hypothetical protein